MSDGRVEFEITADGKKAYASIDDITKKLQQSGVKWEKSAKESTDNIGNLFEGMLKKIAAGFSAAAIGKALVDFGKQAIEAASDLREVQNVVDTTFGEDGAAKIESWAKKAGSQFGLTETQAKRFTSTLGAMMKSSGLAGEQIVEMSTDMAGLVADMASFYNLDFDTAFQKIRSGISGETEPLKALGVNMSVANLEAFALQKGLQKTFSEMSQGEQVMLRYQYLMQATADAQGDFAKTSDGFANASRRVETALETIKTKGGDLLLTVIEPLTSGLADILTNLTTNPNRTVLDEFNEIDANTSKKLADISKSAEEARTLVELLGEIKSDSKTAKDNLEGTKIEIPDKSVHNARDLAGSLSDMAGTGNIPEALGLDELKTGTASLSGTPLDKSVKEIKADAEETGEAFMGLQQETYSLDGKPIKKSVDDLANKSKQLSDNFDAAINYGDHTLTGKPLDKSVEKMASDAQRMQNNLNPENIGKTGLEETPMAKSVEKLGADATAAKEGLEGADAALQQIGEEGVPDGVTSVTEAVGDAAEATETVATASSEWLEVYQRLVKTIPGLSTLIDVQTGEIKGGEQALYDYIDTWERLQQNLTLIDANNQKRAALNAKFTELPSLEVDKKVADYRLAKSREQIERYLKEFGFSGSVEDYAGNSLWDRHTFSNGENGLTYEQADLLNKEIKYYRDLRDEQEKATAAYQEQKDAYDEATIALDEADQALLANMTTEEKAAFVVDQYAKAQEHANAAVEEAKANLESYRKEAVEKATDSVNKLIKGFKKIEAPKLEDAPKPDEMINALESQWKFMQEYQENLAKAKAAGLDENLLAELSDGSEESANYLKAIADNPSHIEEINKQYRAVNEEKKKFAETLADNTLAVDDAYKELQTIEEKARDDQKRVEDEIAKNAGDCVAQMAENINAQAAGLEQAINTVNSLLASLGIPTVNLGGYGGTDGSFASGLNYVPFNGFLAELHEGEGILTAEENRIWQNFKAGQRGVDYDQLGSMMNDIKTGGNVYLDGRVVGSVISQMQGNQYRSLQRSGWQG